MKRRFTAAGVGLVLLFALTLSGQEARVQMEKPDKKFRPGETIQFVVRLDRPANVEIRSVTVDLSAKERSGLDGSYQASNSAGSVSESKVEFRVSVTLPIHAKSGEWHLSGINLNFGGGSKSLKFNELLFEVLPGKEIILPDSATVEIAK